MKKINQAWWILGLLSLSFFVFAEEGKLSLSQPVEPSAYFGQIMTSLILILLIIFVGAWLLKRFGKVNGIANNQMRVLANMAVGQRERVVLLEVGKTQLLIGVTSSKISLLHELDEPLDIESSRPVEMGVFAQKLQEAMRPQRKKESVEPSHKDEIL